MMRQFGVRRLKTAIFRAHIQLMTWKIDMKGPYMANIGKQNHVLEEEKNN